MVYVVGGQHSLTNEHDLFIYRTQDSGANWELVIELDGEHPGAGGLTVAEEHGGIAFTDVNHAWLVNITEPYATVCGSTGWTPAGELMASHDGGRNWARRQLAPLPDGSAQLNTPVVLRGSAGYLIAHVDIYSGKCPPKPVPFVYTTLDGGITWSPPLRLPTDGFITIDGIDWWATDGKHVFRSRNQGATWEKKLAKLPAGDVFLGELFPVGGQAAWAFWTPVFDMIEGRTPPPSRIALLRTTDGGATWSEVKQPRASM